MNAREGRGGATSAPSELKLGGSVAKSSSTLNVRLPPYRYPRTEWRKDIHGVVREEQERRGVSYGADEELELWVQLYFDDVKVGFVDVDNRLKDVMDALQGCVGGSGGPSLPPIIADDSQIRRVVVEKAAAPPQSHGLGHLKIRKYAGGKLNLRLG